MKFIHCADLHLDSAFSSLPQDIAKIRKEEVLNTFERLCDYAENHGVSAVIIAGDMFDTSRVTLRVKNRVLNAIKRHSSVDFLYLSGNHDLTSFLADDEKVENLKVFGSEWTEFNYQNINITGVNFNAFNISSVYDSLALNLDKLNIVVMHGQVAGYKSNEKAEVISIPRLKDKGIDYLALGHIHYYSIGDIDSRGKFVYSGCLDGRGFDELGQKGFVLLEENNGKICHQFIPFSSRTLNEIEFDINAIKDQFEIIEKLNDNLAKSYDSSSLIKVILKGERSVEVEIDKEYIASRLKDKFFFIKVYDKTNLKISLKDFEFDRSVKGEFVREVMSSSLNEQKKSEIIACGLAFLKGEM